MIGALATALPLAGACVVAGLIGLAGDRMGGPWTRLLDRELARERRPSACRDRAQPLCLTVTAFDRLLRDLSRIRHLMVPAFEV